MDPRRLDALERTLGHRFGNRALLERALTHRSAAHDNNERLEFLGDAVLGYVVADCLHVATRLEREDRLTLVRAALVRRETLAAIARELDLGRLLRLGPGARKSGDQDRDSLLANAVEALIGAVHEDGGIERARAVVVTLLGERLAAAAEHEVKDPKTRLQEWLQARHHGLPAYEIVSTLGQDHERRFFVRCEVPALELASEGSGVTRKDAEKAAAERLLAVLEARDG
jgi:ribonuclease-3